MKQIATVVIPVPMPAPFCNYYYLWKTWASSLHHTTIVIGEVEATHSKHGFSIKEPRAPDGAISWIPKSWIILDSNTSDPSKESCDCPIQKLFNQGCPGH